MILQSIELKNFTVFEEAEINFSDGMNVILGGNGAGKTHLLKLLYAASQAVTPEISFPQKIVRCFLPDEDRIARLMKRQQGGNHASVTVTSYKRNLFDGKSLSVSFNSKTPKWEAQVKDESGWKEQYSGETSIFIPAKEVLTNARHLSKAVEKNSLFFDDTYIDIINSAKIDISSGKNSKEKEKRLNAIEKIIGGKVTYDDEKDEFYLRQENKYLEFPLVSEGIRKIALMWQLVKNGTLEKGSILFWDEPEAIINPMNIPMIVDLLFQLQRSGVQIFIATHDYFLTKYLEMHRDDVDEVAFLSLYQTEQGVKSEAGSSMAGLKHNDILKAYRKLEESLRSGQTGAFED